MAIELQASCLQVGQKEGVMCDDKNRACDVHEQVRASDGELHGGAYWQAVKELAGASTRSRSMRRRVSFGDELNDASEAHLAASAYLNQTDEALEFFRQESEAPIRVSVDLLEIELICLIDLVPELKSQVTAFCDAYRTFTTYEDMLAFDPQIIEAVYQAVVNTELDFPEL